MTKFKTFFMSLFICLSVSFFLTHCSEDSTSSNSSGLVGNWELTKMTIEVNGIKMEYTPAQLNYFITLTISDDGTYSITTIDEEGTTNTSGTWTAQGNKLIIVEDGVTQEADYSLSGNKLIISFEEENEGEIITITQEFTRK